MATNTYVALKQTTIGTAVQTVTWDLTGLSGYTDLEIVCNGYTTASVDVGMRFNGDTGAHYSRTYMEGNGTSATSSRESNATVAYLNNQGYPISTSYSWNAIYKIMNYSNTTTYKTILSRSNNASNGVYAGVAMWRGSTGSSTEAITSITITTSSGQFQTGSTFSLYGILAS